MDVDESIDSRWGLTPKQLRFCHEYAIDLNGSRAARDAGYSEESARVIAHENLTKPAVKVYISHLQANLSELTGVTAARNINELSKIAYSNMSRFKRDWMSMSEYESLSENDMAAIQSVDYVIREIPLKDGGSIQETTVKFKLYDKMRAIEILNKMLGFNAPDKMDIKTSSLTPSERKARIQMLTAKLGNGTPNG